MLPAGRDAGGLGAPLLLQREASPGRGDEGSPGCTLPPSPYLGGPHAQPHLCFHLAGRELWEALALLEKFPDVALDGLFFPLRVCLIKQRRGANGPAWVPAVAPTSWSEPRSWGVL